MIGLNPIGVSTYQTSQAAAFVSDLQSYLREYDFAFKRLILSAYINVNVVCI